jgi:ATP adenylyltransferase
MEYIENCDKNNGCIFCDKPQEKNDQKNLIVHRAKYSFVILNRYPYNSGHLLIVPYRHTAELNILSEREKVELFDLLTLSQEILYETMKPQGFNIGMNLGRTAGAGIKDHLHFHIVPRWDGDTNFMPVIGHTKVISEALEQTWEKLNKSFKKQK